MSAFKDFLNKQHTDDQAIVRLLSQYDFDLEHLTNQQMKTWKNTQLTSVQYEQLLQKLVDIFGKPSSVESSRCIQWDRPHDSWVITGRPNEAVRVVHMWWKN